MQQRLIKTVVTVGPAAQDHVYTNLDIYYTRERIVNKTVTYILEEVSTIAKIKYPNDPQCQLHYQLGFLAGQLANTFYLDNKNHHEFKTNIQLAKSK